MENLSAVSALVVSQKKEWGEIATGFETRNRYTVSDGSGNTLYVAAEEPGSMGRGAEGPRPRGRVSRRLRALREQVAQIFPINVFMVGRPRQVPALGCGGGQLNDRDRWSMLNVLWSSVYHRFTPLAWTS